MELEALAELGDAELVDIVMELLEQIQSMGNRLDNIFRFFFPGHFLILKVIKEEKVFNLCKQHFLTKESETVKANGAFFVKLVTASINPHAFIYRSLSILK